MTNCSNNFGPLQYPEKLIPKVIISALNQRPIEIYGDVSQDVIETINRLGIPLKHFKTTRVGYVREKNFQEN